MLKQTKKDDVGASNVCRRLTAPPCALNDVVMVKIPQVSIFMDVDQLSSHRNKVSQFLPEALNRLQRPCHTRSIIQTPFSDN
jgi:hypothetical protein